MAHPVLDVINYVPLVLAEKCGKYAIRTVSNEDEIFPSPGIKLAQSMEGPIMKHIVRGQPIVHKTLSRKFKPSEVEAVEAHLQKFYSFQEKNTWVGQVYGHYFTIFDIDENTCDLRLNLINAFIEGPTLQTHYEEEVRKNGGRADQLFVARIMRDMYNMCELMAKDHIAHLDIKPDNIIVEGGRRLRLIDFALFCRIGRGGSKTLCVNTAGSGTLGYMAPEIWQDHRGGEPAHHDDRYRTKADVFAVSAMGAYFLKGERYWRNRDWRKKADEQLALITSNLQRYLAEGKMFLNSMNQTALDAAMTESRVYDEYGLFRAFLLGMTQKSFKRPSGATLKHLMRDIILALKQEEDYQEQVARGKPSMMDLD